MIKQLSHVSLSAKSLQKVVNFYVKILGFKVIHKFLNEKKEVYGLFLYCNKRTLIEFFKSKKKLKKSLRFRHICFEVSNIKKLKLKLKKKGFSINIKRGRTDGTLNFFIKDFEDNEIEFHQYDRYSLLNKLLK